MQTLLEFIITEGIEFVILLVLIYHELAERKDRK